MSFGIKFIRYRLWDLVFLVDDVVVGSVVEFRFRFCVSVFCCFGVYLVLESKDIMSLLLFYLFLSLSNR